MGEGFPEVAWEHAATAFQVSSWSYASLAQACRPLLANPSSVVGLTFDASVAWPVYGWMGAAKAALESVSRYVARELGPEGIRSNIVAAGPLRSMAMKSIPGSVQFEEAWEGRAPLGWSVTDTEPAGKAVVALLSDWFPATTGEIVHVDGGFHAVRWLSCRWRLTSTSTPGSGRTRTRRSPSATTVAPSPPPSRRRPDGARRCCVLSFGGPEGHDDVMPFLENVTRGRGIPRERLEEVAEHYHHFGGVSPINDQNKALIDALEKEFAAAGIDLPIYWGNRNWAPYVEDAWRQMADDGIEHVYVFATSAYASFSGCRQYHEDIARARRRDRRRRRPRRSCRTTSTHPGSCRPTPTRWPRRSPSLPDDVRDTARLVATAHSIPEAMAAVAGPQGHAYEAELTAAARAGRRRGAPGRGRSTSSGRAAAGRRPCRGWSRTSTTTCARSPRRGRPPSSSSRSGSSATTSR